MSDTTRLALPRLDAAQAQKHVTHNEALGLLDALVQLSVVARNVAGPPVAPVEGARYLLSAAPTGDFAGHPCKLAAFDDGAWRLLTPRKGWRAFVESENRIVVFDGSGWAPLAIDLTEAQNLRLLGVGGAADANNPLLAKLNGAAFTALRVADAGSGDLRVKFDKEQASATVSQLYQTNWSGRAETGLMGDDRYRIKVSPDGASWKEALNVDPATGRVFFPNGASDLATAASVTSGTPAAYLLSAPLRGPLPEGALFWMVPHVANATALSVDPTLQIDQIDAAPLPLKSFDGGALAQGALEAGRALLVRKAAGAYCAQNVRAPVAPLNLLEDGGRFAGNPEPTTGAISTFSDPSYFVSVNGALRASYGLARVGSAMPTALIDLISKIRPISAQVAGAEFYVLQVTAGAGTTLASSVQATNFYQALTSSRTTGRGMTASAYFRVMSGSLVMAPVDNVTRMLIDGVPHNFTANAPERIFTAAQGWKHMQMWLAPLNGGSSSFWPMRVTPGTVFLIATPAVTPGLETIPWDIGPIPSLRVWR
ncbi:MAG: hypothetical protein JWO64_3624 [Hyphomicrobiales bacterium]|nr:hypothetical protein [Hyphomicrobiales bacterium]